MRATAVAGKAMVLAAFLALLALAAQPAHAQSYTFSNLHEFEGMPTDGCHSLAGLLTDPAGNLYGTTSEGGAIGLNNGTVFKISSKGVESLLHSFGGTGSGDGWDPVAGLLLFKGNLYGTTRLGGGPLSDGTVFEMDPAGNETRLISFNDGPGGRHPLGGVIPDAKGNLYGTTYSAVGYTGDGVVFKLVPAAKTPWPETELWTFGKTPGDGIGQ